MRAQFHFHPVPRDQPYKIPFDIAHQVSQNLLLRIQYNFKNQSRPLFHYRSGYGLVSTHGPFSVTAMQCSK
jgi:hypothetical protein